jgi:PhnB protein
MSTSATTIQPYLFFGGRCDEALAFYKSALGATVDILMRYKESPDPTPPGMLAPGWEEKVMHVTFRVGGAIVMASDGCSAEDGKSSGFKLALNVPTEAEADRAFAALADGGTIELPLTKTFWCPKFGMLTDRFGIGWMVSVPAAQ